MILHKGKISFIKKSVFFLKKKKKLVCFEKCVNYGV